MSNHFLQRNADNEPICSCGYKPEILDDYRPWVGGRMWRAKAAIFDHAAGMKENEAAAYAAALAEREAEDQNEPRRSPAAPFRAGEDVKYPRAGVRQLSDGRWLLTFWDGDRSVDVTDPELRFHPDRYTAFAQGWLTVSACRQSGTNLNGMEAA